ncbi:glycosyltransferase family 2 protein [Geomesophilobacter sediminis]|uniref:Glycosyltransferase family 2 protein n=1 Tax=Geomesophilobacter sediminis TaxID=2798584 RepID=A0A8J7JF02_9BACT|nr:glycosyltransferase family 2 protein [Geomesophilobacter sediminis]MBJ6725946.1 glycosyltransferase family 2 protein [Geomesophilobacter sediminis]
MAKVSAYIIGYNEERNIGDAVKSVLWADEVVFVDSFSTDRSAEIAESLGARVVQVPFEGFGKLRTAAINSTKYEWVFSLDTDERCTEAARDEIRELIEKPDAKDVYYTPRRNVFMGRWIRHCGFYPDFRQPQLFRRDKMTFDEGMVHEGFTIHGSIGYMKNYIWQFPYRDLSQLIGKMERYSSLGAIKLSDRGRNASMARAFFSGLAAFIRIYFLKLGFLDGWPGFVISFANFEGTFYRYAKGVELKSDWSGTETASYEG